MKLELAKKPDPKTRNQDKFHQRMKYIKQAIPDIRYKEKHGYIAYAIFCDYIIVRAYPTYISIHTNGDIDHYECNTFKYSDIKWECSDLEFIAQILKNNK